MAALREDGQNKKTLFKDVANFHLKGSFNATHLENFLNSEFGNRSNSQVTRAFQHVAASTPQMANSPVAAGAHPQSRTGAFTKTAATSNLLYVQTNVRPTNSFLTVPRVAQKQPIYID